MREPRGLPPRQERDAVGPSGYAGRPLRPRRSYPSRSARRLDDDSGAGGGRVAGVLLALAVALLAATHGLWQVTAPDAAGRTLRSLLPDLTDLDQTLAVNRDTIREVASGLPPDGTLTVPDLPVTVTLSREEALNADDATLRRAVLERMSERLYQDGVAAFRAPTVAGSQPGLLSSQWFLQNTLNGLTADRHEALRWPRLATAVLVLLLGGLTIWLLEGPARLLGPGMSIVIGALLAGAGALVLRLITGLFFGEANAVDSVVRFVLRQTSATILIIAGSFLMFGLVLSALGHIARRVDQADPAPTGGQRLRGRQ